MPIPTRYVCIECGEPATWRMITQSGEHYFCTEHAHKEKSFGRFFWHRLEDKVSRGIRKTKTIYIVRHGQSYANAGIAKKEHHADIRLTDIGVLQAYKAGAFLRDKGTQAVFSSKYTRAKETAEIICKNINIKTFSFCPAHEFSYISPDEWKKLDDAGRRESEEAFWARCDPHHKLGEDAETFEEFIKRLHCVDEFVCNLEYDTTVLVCHGYVMKGLILFWDPFLKFRNCPPSIQIEQFRYIHRTNRLPNACILEVEICGDGSVRVKGLTLKHLSEGIITH